MSGQNPEGLDVGSFGGDYFKFGLLHLPLLLVERIYTHNLFVSKNAFFAKTLQGSIDPLGMKTLTEHSTVDDVRDLAPERPLTRLRPWPDELHCARPRNNLHLLAYFFIAV